KYEVHHNAVYTPRAIESAVRLSARYLTDRYLPDKAIDVMDEAGAKARIAAMTRPPAFKEIEGEIEQIVVDKEEAIQEQDFEKAAALRDREKQKKEELDRILQEWRQDNVEKRVTVDEDDMMSVVSKWTGVPLQRMEEKEAAKLLKME